MKNDKHEKKMKVDEKLEKWRQTFEQVDRKLIKSW